MSERPLTSQLWDDIEPIFASILEHPFVAGLVAGDLPEATFGHYIVQDALYLQVFAKALSALGGRAPTVDETELFATRAARAISVERSLHRELLGGLGLGATEIGAAQLSPTALAYTSFITARVHTSSFAVGLASVLPCYWIYREVAARLAKQGSPSELYQRWITGYESPEFQAGVDSALAVMDRVGATLGGPERDAVRATFSLASRYEWMFWDAAFRRETWPIAVSDAT